MVSSGEQGLGAGRGLECIVKWRLCTNNEDWRARVGSLMSATGAVAETNRQPQKMQENKVFFRIDWNPAAVGTSGQLVAVG